MYEKSEHVIAVDEQSSKDDEIDCSMCGVYWVGIPLWIIPVIIGLVFICLRLNGHITKPAPEWTCYCVPNAGIQNTLVFVNQTIGEVYCCPSFNISSLCVKAVFGSPKTPDIVNACQIVLLLTTVIFGIWTIATALMTWMYIIVNKCRFWYIDILSILYFLVTLALFGLAVYVETKKDELESDNCKDLTN